MKNKFYKQKKRMKRQKWTLNEDKFLKNLIQKEPDDIDWENISKKMSQINFIKNPRQCRERWNNQLNPILKREKWSLKENETLFHLFDKIGPKWKNISENFEGRSDNCIKNQFFSLVRKGLRNSLKVLGVSAKSISVNKIKPKILSLMMTKKLDLDYFLDKDESLKICVDVRDFLYGYLFRKNIDLDKKKNKFILEEIIRFIKKLNKDYILSKTQKRISKKKKNFKNFCNFEKLKIDSKELGEKNMILLEGDSFNEIKKENESDIKINLKSIKEQSRERYSNNNSSLIKKEVNSNDLIFMISKQDEIFRKLNNVSKTEKQDLKKDLSEIFKELSNNFSKIGNSLKNTNKNHFETFYKFVKEKNERIIDLRKKKIQKKKLNLKKESIEKNCKSISSNKFHFQDFNSKKNSEKIISEKKDDSNCNYYFKHLYNNNKTLNKFLNKAENEKSCSFSDFNPEIKKHSNFRKSNFDNDKNDFFPSDFNVSLRDSVIDCNFSAGNKKS